MNIEYFFDSLKNIENSDVISLKPNTEIIHNHSIDISALNNGLHRFYVNAINNNGKSGIIQNKFLHINHVNKPDISEEITEMELFIDKDPGFNNGITIGSLLNDDYIDIEYILSLKSIIPGIHRIFVRAKNNQDIWGIPNFQSVDIQAIYGDFDYSRNLNLQDAIIVLQILADIKESKVIIQSGANGIRIGMKDIIFILKWIAKEL